MHEKQTIITSLSDRGNRVSFDLCQSLSVPFIRRCLFILVFLINPVQADDLDILETLDIEQLMNIEVTSVSKKSQSLANSPAAIFVISQEDIKRSGASSIPETLRMVPGMNVAHVSASQWAVSARGFNDLYANKLLVMIDGRSIYNPNFSGTVWDIHDVVLDDIERIEVIRGPGGSLWGANAVNWHC